jgi:hypothetical protein
MGQLQMQITPSGGSILVARQQNINYFLVVFPAREKIFRWHAFWLACGLGTSS